MPSTAPKLKQKLAPNSKVFPCGRVTGRGGHHDTRTLHDHWVIVSSHQPDPPQDRRHRNWAVGKAKGHPREPGTVVLHIETTYFTLFGVGGVIKSSENASSKNAAKRTIATKRLINHYTVLHFEMGGKVVTNPS